MNDTHIRWAWSFALFGAAFATGLEIEKAEYDRMTRFRDKSALFAGTKPAGDTEVTWGRPKGKSDCHSSITCILDHIFLQITSHGGSCTTQDK